MTNIPAVALAIVAVGSASCSFEENNGVEQPALEPAPAKTTQTGYALTVSGISSTAACLFDLNPMEGWSYQTPAAAQIGVAAVELLRSVDDAEPHLLVERTPAHQVDLTEGTTFAQVDTGSIPEGTYTHMRVKLDRIAFEVAATAHVSGFSLPGALAVDYALSDHDSDELGARAQGDYLAEFVASGVEVPQIGVRPVEYPPSYPEATVNTNGGEYWVTFLLPTSPIVVSHQIPEEVDVDVQFCIEGGFAWDENDVAGHSDGVFDLDFDPAATEQPMSMAIRGFTLAIDD